MNELIENIKQWSIDRNLDDADSKQQILKSFEEFGEMVSAFNKDDRHEFKDGIGDVLVTLIILAQQQDTTLEECLAQAYNEIKNRDGETVDGMFIKSEDLSTNPLEDKF